MERIEMENTLLATETESKPKKKQQPVHKSSEVIYANKDRGVIAFKDGDTIYQCHTEKTYRVGDIVRFDVVKGTVVIK